MSVGALSGRTSALHLDQHGSQEELALGGQIVAHLLQQLVPTEEFRGRGEHMVDVYLHACVTRARLPRQICCYGWERGTARVRQRVRIQPWSASQLSKPRR